MYVKKIRAIDGYLSLAKLLPFDEELPPADVASPEIVRKVNELWGEALANQPELRLPVVGGTPKERYALFRMIRLIVRVTIDVVNDSSVRFPPGSYGTIRDDRIDDLNRDLPPMQRGFALTFGGVVPYADELQVFLNCLKDLGSEYRSLKSCPICTAPFLPRRADQKACSIPCNSTFRARTYRTERKNAAAARGKAR